jgi:hypothetical protein
MKNLNLALTMAVVLGTVGVSFAGNRPSLTYPEGVMAAPGSSPCVVEVTPWHKGALAYKAGTPEVASTSPTLVEVTPWHKGQLHYVKGILATKPATEMASSNAKKLILSSADLVY